MDWMLLDFTIFGQNGQPQCSSPILIGCGFWNMKMQKWNEKFIDKKWFEFISMFYSSFQKDDCIIVIQSDAHFF